MVFHTLVELLRFRALHQPDQTAYCFLQDGETSEIRLSYAELDARARAIAAALQSRTAPGERALLFYPPGLDFIAGFFGCLYAGVIAVPAYPPHASRRDRALQRLKNMALNASPALALTAQSMKGTVDKFVGGTDELRRLAVLATDELDSSGADTWIEPAIDSGMLAFLQYTSGSTGSPKGVMVSHGNLLSNSESIRGAFKSSPNSAGVVWLPPYHDMGLIGGILQPLYAGFQVVLMAPATFLQRPLRWLEAISRYKGTISGGPNFAYDLCVSKITSQQLSLLDLSSWTLAFNGSEPIRPETMERFAETFAPCGFRREAFYPCYGLAEATLLVTGGEAGVPYVTTWVDADALGRNKILPAPAGAPGSSRLVGCGKSREPAGVRIVDPETLEECEPERIGEIWASGPGIAQGYWGDAEQSEAVFRARLPRRPESRFLRTGDLGFLRDGELYVAGRLKDLIIVRGVNHYPQDIEATVEKCHAALRPAGSAAFSVVADGQEKLVVIQELERQYCKSDPEQIRIIVEAIRTALAENHDIELHAVRFLKPGGLPRTSSGKIQRRACRDLFLNGEFEVLAAWTEPSEGTLLEPVQVSSPSTVPSKPAAGQTAAEAIEDWLIARLSQRLKVRPETLDPRAPFSRYGLDSLGAVAISGELEEWLGRRLSPTLAWEYPNIQLLASHLAGEARPRTGEAAAAEAEPIAIVGIGCRFPGAHEAAAFWELLRNGVDGITEVPGERWDIDAYYDPDPAAPGKMNTRSGGFLHGIDLFDPQFFGIAPREAVRMDPQQRLLLEVAWEALEDAGQVPELLAGSNTGVFVGISTNDYGRRQMDDLSLSDPYAAIGSALSIAANRISYFLNLRGPSMAVDTACSSSLVAVHLACSSLWRGEAALALAGGVNLTISPSVSVNLSKSGFLSPDGRCKAFDARANGYVRGEGAGLVVLKPLSQAVADGDSIYALIRGSAVNQDGRSNGITAPNPQAQEAVLQEAYRRAGISPGLVQYVEAHGTGTLLGDPIEASALAKVIAADRAAGEYCALGSVKSNIGHLEAAAGVAGLIKATLSIKHRQLPASLHFEEANPHIPFNEIALRVQKEAGPWPNPQRPLVAGVSSFGFGGTNAHVVLSEAGVAAEQDDAGQEPDAVLLPLSGHTAGALKEMAGKYAAMLSADGACTAAKLRDVCFTAGARRTHHEHRWTSVASTAEELVGALTAFSAGQADASTAAGSASFGRQPKVAFVFSGQGLQYWGMGRDLLEREPVFRDTLQQCDTLLRSHADWSLVDELTAPESHSRLAMTEVAQPVLFCLQMALAKLWNSWGVTPSAVAGHSMGEVAAACVAGVLGLEDALRLIVLRGRLMQRASGQGKMAAVELSRSDAESAIAAYRDRLVIAAHNGPTSTVLSGEPAALEELLHELEQRGVFCRALQGEVAFHSPQMDWAGDELRSRLAGLKTAPATVPIFSTVTGDQGNEDFGAAYWARNARQPVLFAQAAAKMVESGFAVFVEVSPHPVLSAALVQTAPAGGKKIVALPSMYRGRPERETILKSLGSLYVMGAPVDWRSLYPGARTTALPSYAWQRERCWIEDSAGAPVMSGPAAHSLLGRRLRVARPVWEATITSSVPDYLGDHRLQGRAVLPASASIEMAVAAAAEISPSGASYVLEEIDFSKACFLPEGEARTLQTVLEMDDSAFKIYGRPSGSDSSWSLHVFGKVRALEGVADDAAPEDLEAIRTRCTHEISSRELYRAFLEAGLEYGPCFRGIDQLWCGNGEALGRIRLPAGISRDAKDYFLHPAALDACFQVAAGLLADPRAHSASRRSGYLPVELRHAHVLGRGQSPAWSHAVIEELTTDSIQVRVRVLTADGNLLLDARGLRCRAVGDPNELERNLNDLLYEDRWVAQALTAGASHFLPQPVEIAEATSVAAGRYGTELDLIARYKALEPELDALCSRFILDAFRELGGVIEPGQSFTAAAFAERLGVIPRYRDLLNRYLEILAGDGFLQRNGAVWAGSPAGSALKWSANGNEQSPLQRWRELLSKNPAFYGELTLLGRCAGSLPKILRGETDPLQVIFPGGSMAMTEYLYQDSPSLRFYNTVVQRAIAAAVEALPAGTTMRVLEIGAGTGGLTTRLLPALPAENSKYVFTDVSSHFLAKAAEKFREHGFVEYRRLDIEADPVEQGFAPNSFDIILASEAIHATADLRGTLQNIKRLLASEGLLVLLEAVRPARWVDLVFGLTEGWWRFTDRDLRPSYPLLSLAGWRSVLSEAGFSGVTEASGRPENTVENAVILSRGPRIAGDTRLASESGPQRTPARWIFFADRAGLAERIAVSLRSRGDRCSMVYAGTEYRPGSDDRFYVRPEQPGEIKRIVGELMGPNTEGCAGIVHLWNLDSPATPGASAADVMAAQAGGCMSVAYLAQEVFGSGGGRSPRLWMITQTAQQAGPGADSISICQAPVWGMGRVIANEMPQLRATLVDLSGDPGDHELQLLVDEMVRDGPETEVALRGNARYVHRYARAAGQDMRVVRMYEEPFRLQVKRPGLLDSLTFVAAERREPGPGQVEIQVKAAGLNFSDVLKCLGMVPASTDGAMILGLECSGKVTRIGPGVRDLEIGSEVVAIAPHSLAPFVTTSAGFVAIKPAHLNFEEAATIPIAFLTSWYALRHLARLSLAERVLVHSAAGGVGLAAVQIARTAGADVFASAGTEEKRGFLRALGIPHVMDSRSGDFAGWILEETQEQGVDVVLNSLAGEAIERGLEVLSDYGRFLEIGKQDISRNNRIGLRPFKKNLAFFGVDLDRTLRDRPALMSSLFSELMRDIAAGTLQPLPHRVFPASAASAAFRYMARAQHIGKVVVSFEEECISIEAPAKQADLFRSDATYLVTGGLGGFGLKVARWLADAGVRHLVLTGRRGAEEDAARQAITELRESGAEVTVVQADVSRSEDVARILSGIRNSMPPLRGVFHAAMVLEDCLVINLKEDLLRKVCAPKINGAWNLHTQTLNDELEFFVLFSSMSSVFGIPGQASYAAANAFLDSLASYRRSLGLPAAAINWGYLSEVGWVARQPEVGARLQSQGIEGFSPREALSVLERTLRRDSAQVGVVRINWSRWAQSNDSAPVPPKFAALVRETGIAERSAGDRPSGLDRATLLASAPDERRRKLQAYLREQVGRVLGLPVSRIADDQPVGKMGLDSLMAVELKNRVESDLRVALPVVAVLEEPSIIGLATRILSDLDGLEQKPLADATARAGAAAQEITLSSSQRWMWCLHQLDPHNPWCNFPVALRLAGSLNVPAFERSCDEVVRRHEVLRTRVLMVDDRPSVSLAPYEGCGLAFTDLSSIAPLDREPHVLRLAMEEALRPFDIERGPLFRFGLLRLASDEHVVLITMHHMVTDVLSMDVFLRELASLYPAFSEGKPSPLPDLPIQYTDFTLWEQQMLKSESLQNQLASWKERLAGGPSVLEFPTDHPRSANQTYRGGIARLELQPELLRPLRELGRSAGCTLYMVLLAVFQVLLYRYTGQEDFAVGSFASSRTRPELKELMGCFINHLVLRADLSGNPGFRDLLLRVREVTLEAYANQDVPFEMLLEELHVKRTASRTPLFQVAFAFDPAPSLALPGLSISDLALDYLHSNFDFTLRIQETKNSLKATMEYNSVLFEPATIDRLLQAFATLTGQICTDPSRTISSIPLLSDADRRLLLGEWQHDEPADAAPDGEDRGAARGLDSVALKKLRLARSKRTPKPS